MARRPAVSRSKAVHPLGALTAALLAAWPGLACAQEPGAHRLGPQDLLRVRVVLWDEDALGFELWPAVSGDYTVGPDGAVLIPLAGAMRAEGLTAAEVSDAVSRALESRLGLIEAPEVAVEVVEHRPFYVLGDVDRPGAYPATPGLVAAQALALAGGQVRATSLGLDPLGPVRDAGALRGVSAEIARALAREARLAAELAGREALDAPPRARHPDGAAAMEAVMASERAILAADRDAVEREVEALEDLQALLSAEIAALEAKLAGQAEAVALARETYTNTQSLVERGLSRAPQLAAAQRSLIELEGSELDLQTLIFRARQRASEAERDIVGLRARREARATAELQEVRAELDRLRARRETLARVLAEGGTATLADDLVLETRFEVLRGAGGEDAVRLEAGEATAILPGDVLTVTLAPAGAPPR